MTANVDLSDASVCPRPPGGWPLSVPLQVAELEALAAASRRARTRALIGGAVLVPVGVAVLRLDPVLAAIAAAVAGERLVRASRYWHAARSFEIEAMVCQLRAGTPRALGPGAPPVQASLSAVRRGWRTPAGSRQ